MTVEQGNRTSRALISGVGAIADYYGLPVNKTYRLASAGVLPGVFKLGRAYFLDPVSAAEGVRAKAGGGANG